MVKLGKTFIWKFLLKRTWFTLCNIIATNTITSTSVFDVDTAAPRATPSATMIKKIQCLLNIAFQDNKMKQPTLSMF